MINPFFNPPVALSIIWLMPKDFMMPPFIIHKMPVPAQAIHFIKPARSMPSSFLSDTIRSSFIFLSFFVREQTSVLRERRKKYLQHPAGLLDERRDYRVFRILSFSFYFF